MSGYAKLNCFICLGKFDLRVVNVAVELGVGLMTLALLQFLNSIEGHLVLSRAAR